MKKKPVVLMNNVHTDPEDGVKGAHDNWITAVTALRYSDLAASGENIFDFSVSRFITFLQI